MSSELISDRSDRLCNSVEYGQLMILINRESAVYLTSDVCSCCRKKFHAGLGLDVSSWWWSALTVKPCISFDLASPLLFHNWCFQFPFYLYILDPLLLEIGCPRLHSKQSFLNRAFSYLRPFVCSSLGAMGVPVQYERNFRAKLDYFRAQCAFHLLSGHAKLTISRDDLLEDSFQQVFTLLIHLHEPVTLFLVFDCK